MSDESQPMFQSLLSIIFWPFVTCFNYLNALDEWIRNLAWWQLIVFWIGLGICTYIFIWSLQALNHYTSKDASKRALLFGKNGAERQVRSDEYVPEPETYTLPEFKRYTWRELKNYNGKDKKPILIAVRGKIYDMTSHWTGRILYGEGSSYYVFAGNDATRALATLQFDQVNRKDIDTLTAEEKQTLKEWEETYEGKYKIVGELIEDPDDPPLLHDEEEVVVEEKVQLEQSSNKDNTAKDKNA